MLHINLCDHAFCQFLEKQRCCSSSNFTYTNILKSIVNMKLQMVKFQLILYQFCIYLIFMDMLSGNCIQSIQLNSGAGKVVSSNLEQQYIQNSQLPFFHNVHTMLTGSQDIFVALFRHKHYHLKPYIYNIKKTQITN